MDLGITDKQIVITGGSKGIGAAIAHGFAVEGAEVIIATRDGEALDKTAAEISKAHDAKVIAHAEDLSSEAGRQRMFDAFPDADILVNNAGGIADIDMKRWREAWDLKVFGYIHMCQLYVAAMKQRKDGIIINIAGMGGRTLKPDYICGAAGNAAVIGFTNALGAETPNYNVRIFGINPAATMTDRIVSLSKTRAKTRFGDESRWEDILNPKKMPFGCINSAEEVASLAVMLCAPQVHYLSGTVIDMDGGGQWRA
jgi:3-oxoacyl-[acyl-carrier protein] reductase